MSIAYLRSFNLASRCLRSALTFPVGLYNTYVSLNVFQSTISCGRQDLNLQFLKDYFVSHVCFSVSRNDLSKKIDSMSIASTNSATPANILKTPQRSISFKSGGL